ncbi:MAG: hypothetical protein AAGH74_02755 [Pseudomonadota bacterium]
MPNWDLLDWIGVVAAVAGVIGTYIAWRSFRGPSGGTYSKITIKNSPGAKVAGRNTGTSGGDKTPTDTVIEVTDSKDAEAAGRDLKR